MINSEQIKKLNYINYSFKKLGTIDITNFKNRINNLSDDNWDENCLLYTSDAADED